MITVIVPTRLRPRLLRAALISIAAQTCQDLDVVVVNDGGPSLSGRLDAWSLELGLAITLVELPEQRGVSAARNAGIDAAGGELLAFLDDDDVFLPHHLATAVSRLETTGSDLVYTGALVADRRLTAIPADHRQMPAKAYSFDPDFLLVANYLHTGSVVCRSFRETKARFDESLSLCEDWDMWLALTQTLGYRATSVAALTCIYHQMRHTSGLVAGGQRTVPSAFSLVRQRLHATWPSSDERVQEFRDWMTAFEDQRNQQIAAGRPIPHQLFDHVLAVTHRWFTEGRNADPAEILRLFREAR